MTAERDYIERRLDRIETQVAEILALLRIPTGGAPAPAHPAEPPPSPIPAPAGFPADIFGRGWKLTLPVGDGRKAMEIRQPALAGYTSRWCELNPDRRSVIFRAPHGAATTPGSSNPRSELREMNADGTRELYWSVTSGRHRMDIELAFNRTTKIKPDLVGAQIHGSDDDITVLRLEGTRLWITSGDTSHGHLLTANYRLGEPIAFGFDVEGGRVRYTYQGRPVPYEVKTTDGECYFKTGAYVQSNAKTAPGEDPAEYGEVQLFAVSTSHT